MNWIKTQVFGKAFDGLRKVDLLLMVVFALCAGHYLVVHQEPEHWWELLLLSAYYPALLGSFLIAFTVSASVCYINSCLNVVQPWLLGFFKRLALQLIFGVVVPIFLMVLLASLYFSLRGQTIWEADYFRIDFGQGSFFILFLNLFYFAWYVFDTLMLYYKPVDEQFVDLDEAEEVEVSEQPSVSEWIHSAYFYHDNRVNFSVSFEGTSLPTGLLMDELETYLPSEDFFRVQKGFILHRAAITTISNASSHRVLAYLKTPYHKALGFVDAGDRKINYVVVPQRRAGAFKVWWINGRQ